MYFDSIELSHNSFKNISKSMIINFQANLLLKVIILNCSERQFMLNVTFETNTIKLIFF